ncbi:hypothetical protein F4777DRAFT_592830 [Nemania sp. FL0916]|nr:hypothetical protein F4777DRAFT_592830 [Nemania sp. FL0916]
MADEIPTIHILNKLYYQSQQAVVALPSALPYPPLASSSLRIRTRVLSLSINNFTYALLGPMLGWYNIHPLPASTPAPYKDSSKYGRIGAWGYTEVMESTVAAVPAGSYLWGYVPLGTLAEDVEVEVQPPVMQKRSQDKDQEQGDVVVVVTSPHRRKVLSMYNRYVVYRHDPNNDDSSNNNNNNNTTTSTATAITAAIARHAPEIAHDAILRVMHSFAFCLASFAFSPDSTRVVDLGVRDDDGWTAVDADLTDATVLIFAPGSKAAVLFATLLSQRRHKNPQQGQGQVQEQEDERRNDNGCPGRIIGASSESSRAFVVGTQAYDTVVLTSDDPLSAVPRDDSKSLVIFDFGGRFNAATLWALALEPRYPDLLYVDVGISVGEPINSNSTKTLTDSSPELTHYHPLPYRSVPLNADTLRRRAVQRVGEATYCAEEAASWAKFRRVGIRGLEMVWGEGVDDVARGWDRIARGEYVPSQGLVYKL